MPRGRENIPSSRGLPVVQARGNEWYGQKRKIVQQIATGKALWYKSHYPNVPIRWVLIKYPDGQPDPVALLCTGPAPPQGLGFCPSHPAFSDAIDSVQRQIWRNRKFLTTYLEDDVHNLSAAFLNTLDFFGQ